MGCLTKTEVTKLLTITAAMYPRFEISEVKIDIWTDLIGDLPFPVAQAALKKVMLISEFPPTVAQIRKAAAEITSTETLDAGQAWGEVQRAVSKWGWPEPEKAYAMMSPTTLQVVKQIGWREICMCEEPGVVRGQFMKMFNTMETRHEQDRMLPESFKAHINTLAKGMQYKQIEAKHD